MTEVQQTTTLRDLTRDQGSYGTPGIIDEHDVVILGYGNDGWIEVYCDNGISSFAPGTAVMPSGTGLDGRTLTPGALLRTQPLCWRREIGGPRLGQSPRQK